MILTAGGGKGSGHGLNHRRFEAASLRVRLNRCSWCVRTPSFQCQPI